jgi:hypothetical protein
MARIPSANLPTAGDLGVRTIQPTTDVIRWDVSHVGKGLSAVGAGVKDLAEGIEKVAEKQDEFDVANAGSGLYTDLAKFSEAAGQQPFDDKNPENWEKEQRHLLEERAKSISNPAKRAKFLAEGNMQLTRNQSELLGVHDTKRKESKKGKFNDSAHSLISMESARKDFSKLQDTLDKGYEEIEALRSDNVIGDDEVGDYKRLFASELYKNKLPSASKETRRAILERQKALAIEGKNMIPVSYIESEMEKLNDEEKDDKALAYVTANYKGSVTGLIRKMQKDGVDVDTFTKSVNISNGMYAAADREKKDAAENAYIKAYDLIDSGKATIDEIKKTPLWNAMSPPMKENFKQHGVKRPDFSSIDDTMHLTNLIDRAKGGEVAPLKDYMMSHGNSLSSSDYKMGRDALTGTYPDTAKMASNRELAVTMYPNKKKKAKQDVLFAELTKFDNENAERGVTASHSERVAYAKSMVNAIENSTTVDMYSNAAVLRASRDRLSDDATEDLIEQYQEIGGRIGDDVTGRAGQAANSYALGNVALWEGNFTDRTGKRPNNDDLRKQYAVEVYVFDDEQRIKRYGFQQARKHQKKMEKLMSGIDIDIEVSDRDAFSQAVDAAHKSVRRSYYERGLNPDSEDLQKKYENDVAVFMGKSNIPVLDKYMSKIKPKSAK